MQQASGLIVLPRCPNPDLYFGRKCDNPRLGRVTTKSEWAQLIGQKCNVALTNDEKVSSLGPSGVPHCPE